MRGADKIMLKGKKETFCREWVIDHNGTRAATKAGYSEKSAASIASRLMKDPEIRARIEQLEADAAEAVGLTVIGVLKGIIDTRERCMQAVEVMEWDREKREYVPTGEWQFDSAGANRASELLGKHLGIFTDKVEGDMRINSEGIEQLLKNAIERTGNNDAG